MLQEVWNWIQNLISDSDGAVAEYELLLVLVAVGSIVILALLGVRRSLRGPRRR